MLTERVITLTEANRFVIEHHRHHGACVGCKFCLGAFDSDGIMHGVSIVGRPVSRFLDNGKTAEVTRLCSDGMRNVCSFLYAASARHARSAGYSKIITYILESETGASLKAAGWALEKDHCGKPRWNAERYADRPKQMTLFQKKKPPAEFKKRWAKEL